MWKKGIARAMSQHIDGDPTPLKTYDLRIVSIRPLIPPAILMEQLPLDAAGALAVTRSREQVVDILNGKDDRLVAIVGPCSIHDPDAALEYAHRLKAFADQVASDLFI